MAFQSDILFADFLRETARTVVQSEAFPAMNFLLEERLPGTREKDFLNAFPGSVPKGWGVDAWRETFVNHYSEKIALPLRRALAISTFADGNQDNHLAIESHQDVVRLESLSALHNLSSTVFSSVSELAAEIRNLIRSRQPGLAGSFSDDQRSRLESWVEELNAHRDARPAFVAPYGEVESLLTASDWPTRLRNVLGLAHLEGSPSKPLPVVLCRYSLSRVEGAARKAKLAAWATVPTVLEAGGFSGPSVAFFPFPKATAAAITPFGFGVTVSLTPNDGVDFKSELLHFRIDYTLNDFVMVGEITDTVSEAQLSIARNRHFDLLEQELTYRSDVP